MNTVWRCALIILKCSNLNELLFEHTFFLHHLNHCSRWYMRHYFVKHQRRKYPHFFHMCHSTVWLTSSGGFPALKILCLPNFRLPIFVWYFKKISEYLGRTKLDSIKRWEKYSFPNEGFPLLCLSSVSEPFLKEIGGFLKRILKNWRQGLFQHLSIKKGDWAFLPFHSLYAEKTSSHHFEMTMQFFSRVNRMNYKSLSFFF